MFQEKAMFQEKVILRKRLRSRFRLGALALMVALVTGAVALAEQPKNYVVRYFELTEIGLAPGEIMLSPDYQTIIEFEELSVETASSGRADQLTVEIDDQMIRIRANQDVVNTDLTVKVGGKTALFILRSDPTRQEPLRYVVFNK
jgi:hypothetical protein